MADIRVRLALPDDIEEIVRIHRLAVNALKGGPYDDGTIEAWADSLTYEDVQKGMRTPGMAWFVAVVGEKAAGFASIHKSEVKAIYVHPGFQNLGIGSRLLGRVEEEGRERGHERLTLSSSLNARRFYEAHGYRVIRERIFPLNNEESMTTLSMLKTLIIR